MAGVLWELSLDDGAQRLVSALISSVPAVSYSASPQPGLVELSRALGFREHLVLPLRLEMVERALGLRELVELADRLDASAPRLTQLASEPGSVGAILRAVNVAGDPVGVSEAIARQVSEWVPISEWFVFSVEPDGVPQLVGHPDADPALKAALRSFADVVAATGAPAVRITNYLDDRILGDRLPARAVEISLVGWPLVAAGVTIGVLVGQDTGRAHRLPAISRSFADAITRLLEPASYTLANALRVARAEALSVTDDLTQLYNRRYLNDILRRETKRAMRSGQPLSLIFVDLDGFKTINDTHGHLLGNRALVEAADVMRSCARDSDIVTRWGGDEFALLLPETGAEGAHAVAKRVRDRLERFTFLNGLASTNRITASLGVATLPDVADTAEGLLQAADAAMYKIKVTSKNGIHVAGSERIRPVLAAEE
ncbi:MAG: GGDEF domain-containing protein [Acidobacteria bacterium]|nr:GGDEF domain-containing protein [Acidobacteriota bacterium]